MAFDFSDISLEMLEDNIWTEVVSSSILVRARERVKTLDWTRIPEEIIYVEHPFFIYTRA